MAKKIYLSPSNQTNNRYAWGDTTEAVQCERIADACETALKRCGFEVKNGRGTMSGKVSESNSWGADLHICIHTNAFNGQVSGTRVFCSSLNGVGGQAAKAVYDVLAPFTPGTSENVKEINNLYEINNTKAYCVYVEVDFHDVESVAQWIVEHTTEIGEKIARGICNFYKVKYVSPKAKNDDPAPATCVRYYRYGDVPAVYRADLNKLVEKGLLNGRGGTGDDMILDMSDDVVRCLVILARAIA